jgi:undecaprenyl phosphate N,N'-diacetylbacillosamine 1-phosphate transferase
MIYKFIKRLLDVILSVIGLIILSPILLITAIAIKLESKGPVIFQQDRLGLNGKAFKIYKFRSMCVGAEKDGVYETKGDMRVTKVGRIIRKTSIDELPQFVNIIKGDMSIIGPRPTLTYHPWPIEKYTNEQRKRFNVRPGVTGWAQINGRKDVPWDKRIEYDVWYVDNLSFGLDFKIFFKTLIKVLTMQDNINVGETAANNTELSTTKSETAATIIKD